MPDTRSALRRRPRPARDHCLSPSRAVDAPLGGAKYGRMFPELPALRVDGQLLRALGRVGGSCDASVLAEEADCSVAAWWPVFGQYVAHDITADRSPLTHHDVAEVLRNFRQPRTNLECLYGEGPVAAPYLFSRADPAKLLTGADDLPRNAEGVALVGDPRQDVHVLISQMHLAMIRAHNRLVDRLRTDGVAEAELYDAARRALLWHYQWVILNDFLPTLIGGERAAKIERSARLPDQPSIPLEFADAAYRYGHSQMRQTYQLQKDGPGWSLFPDLLGFGPVATDRVVDWRLLAGIADRPPPQCARPIDGRLPAALLRLPMNITGEVDSEDLESLATRDLMRGTATELPSGEAVAARLGVDAVPADRIGLAGQSWSGETPLWFYILREAEVFESGERLGPVGSHIVGTTLITIVDADPEGFRQVDPDWRPSLPSRQPNRFTLADLLLPV